MNNLVSETAAQQRLQRRATANGAKLQGNNRREQHHVEIHQPEDDEDEADEANEMLKPISRRDQGPVSRKILFLVWTCPEQKRRSMRVLLFGASQRMLQKHATP